MPTVTFDAVRPFLNKRTDPFVDQLTLRYRPREHSDLYTIFDKRARWQMRKLDCGKGTVSVRVQPDYLTVSASPVKIAHGVNAFPRTSNYHLLSTFVRELSAALSQHAVADVHLVLDAILRADLTVMADLGDPAYAQQLFGLLRLILRCTKPNDLEGRLRARYLYDNSIIFGAYDDPFSVKLYRKSALPLSGLVPIIDRWIRIEVSVTGPGAATLMDCDTVDIVEHILVNARYLFDRVCSGFVLMPKQLRSSHRPSFPVPEYVAAYHAWLEHGYQPSMYPPQARRAIELAYRNAGIDLSQPPVPLRVSDRLRPALQTSLPDLLDPRRVTLVGPNQAGNAFAQRVLRGAA